MKNIKKYSYIRENSLVKDIFIVSSVSDLYKYLDFNFAPIGNMSKTICGYNLFNINIIKSNIKDIYFCNCFYFNGDYYVTIIIIFNCR